ncbi:hypothetical protein D3C78_1373090 [compost metagenome]
MAVIGTQADQFGLTAGAALTADKLLTTDGISVGHGFPRLAGIQARQAAGREWQLQADVRQFRAVCQRFFNHGGDFCQGIAL